MHKQKGNDSDLMFSDGLDQDTIEIVDYNTKSKNNDIFGHSSGERVSIGRLTRHVYAIWWGIHWADLKILQGPKYRGMLKNIYFWIDMNCKIKTLNMSLMIINQSCLSYTTRVGNCLVQQSFFIWNVLLIKTHVIVQFCHCQTVMQKIFSQNKDADSS